MNAAIIAATASIAAVPQNGLADGTEYVNTAVPSTTHVRDIARWPVVQAQDGTLTFEGLEASIAIYAAAEGDTAARNAVAPDAKMEFSLAVILAVARASAVRFYNWTPANLNVHECAIRPANQPVPTVHADHQADVAQALRQWSTAAPRYMGVVFYNAISYETASHHHKPEVTRRLASTTIALMGLREYFDQTANAEGILMHDMFHVVSDANKAAFARNVAARQALSNLKFDNLRKRIPVKSPDCGLALNYAVLFAKARGYAHVADDLPDGMAPPATLSQTVRAYESAPNPAALVPIVDALRGMSEALGEPAAYLAGFCLGKDARSTENEDLELRDAKRTNTILGCPALARMAAEYPGTFAEGKARGYAPMSAAAERASAAAIRTRVVAAVTRAGAIPAVGGAPAAAAAVPAAAAGAAAAAAVAAGGAP